MATEDRLAGLPVDRDGPLFDAGYGALVTIVFSFVPFSPVAGGAVAAFRAKRGYLGGFGLGLLAGVGAAVPLGALFVPALRITSWFGVGIPPSSPAYGLFLALLAGLFLSYTIGLSALGGLVGTWARRHTDWDLSGEKWF